MGRCLIKKELFHVPVPPDPLPSPAIALTPVLAAKNSPFGLLALIRFDASTYWDQQLERK
jgi:hypothetical protein